jgi:translation initiation factor 2 alpha subunit (eIF-2alpha)
MAQAKPKRWSGEVTRNSNALDLEKGVFAKEDPHEIALSLKRSAEHSQRRKAQPFQSAMSMLNLYINRAGKNLPKQRLKVLNQAKDELRELYGRPRKD